MMGEVLVSLDKVRKWRWPIDAEDTLTFGGSVAIGVGAGHRWGWDIGLVIFGAFMLFVAITPLRKVIDGRHNKAQ